MAIEDPDREAVPRSQVRLRSDVDMALSDLIVDDLYGLEIEVITVTGTPDARVREVAARLRDAI